VEKTRGRVDKKLDVVPERLGNSRVTSAGMARSTAARQGCCVALRLGEDNARFLLLFFVMLLYIITGAGIFSLLERDNEI